MAKHHEDLFLFPGAPSPDAQPELVEALERFRKLPEEERRKVHSFWGWLIGEYGTPPYKHVKPGVRYLDPSPFPENTCGNCNRWYTHGVTGTPICDAMRGVIDLAAWCDRWEEAADPEEYAAYQDRGHEELVFEDRVAALVTKPK